MDFEIKHTTGHYIRVRLLKKILTDLEAFNFKQMLYNAKYLKITSASIHQRPASLMIEHNGDNDDILKFIKNISIEELNVETNSKANGITSKKELYKLMSPELKRELKKEIIMEGALDTILPGPLGIAYHLYQLASLEAM